MDFGVANVKSTVAKNERHKYESGKPLPPFTLTPKETQAGKSYYGVRIVNGEMAAAGTTGADVFVTLVGNKASTGKVSIYSYLFHSLSGIGSGTCEDLIVESDASLGDVLVVILGISKGDWALDSTWFVNYTVVKDLDSNVETEFPCYHWIEKHTAVTTTSKTATLKDVGNNEILKEERKKQLTAYKKQYQWQMLPGTGLPSAIDDTVDSIPLDQEFSRVKNFDFISEGAKTAAKVGLEAIVTKIEDLADYKTLTKYVDKSGLPLERAGRWTSDVEFGRQILNGINPVIIRRCTKLPDTFPVTNEMVQPFLTRGKTLQKEMADGHVYICDMAIMDGLPARKGQYVPAPICLLYVNSSKQLVPIAIQLKQGVREEEKGQPNPIFLPSDNWIDWLLAKIYYQSSHGQNHQISTHYFSCHAAMEAYSMATVRNLPNAHPINKLLLPHFRFTMAINTRARSSLINDGGAIDMSFGIGGQGRVQLFQRTSKEYSVDWTNIKKYVTTRGVDDAEKLPGYHYRDDGIKIFNAFEDYVRDVVNTFYASDEDVQSDSELQNWADDIYTNAFPSYFGGKQGRDFPQKITSKDQLIERCTVIMFTGSAQHASINFGQYQIYGYAPNAPVTVRRPPPSKKGVTDYQTFLDSLPDKTSTVLTITLVHVLSQYSKDEVFVGDYPYKRFTEANIQQSIKNLKMMLEGIAGEIILRNEKLDVPYTYMLPKGIPNSITI